MGRKNKNGIFYVVISLVAVLAVAGSVAAYALTQNVNVDGDYNYYEATQTAPEGDINLGAAAGPDHYQRNHFYGGVILGGSVLATSSTHATYTWATNDFPEEVTTIIHTPNVNTTITTPTDYATNSILGLTHVGDSRTIRLKNASSTAASSITIAAGAGVDLQYDEDSADLAIAGLDWADLTFLRTTSAGSTTLFMTEFTEAD